MARVPNLTIQGKVICLEVTMFGSIQQQEGEAADECRNTLHVSRPENSLMLIKDNLLFCCLYSGIFFVPKIARLVSLQFTSEA